ncbi:hypothetical protein LTR28_011234 [Elasticomyces elasticus]|nr:hypothetical protein LTR28_011234 [Elasticomyces elasticus]KAK4987935.1 hypothetical protein LTR50_004272 [Elasticomyces elasticus]
MPPQLPSGMMSPPQSIGQSKDMPNGRQISRRNAADKPQEADEDRQEPQSEAKELFDPDEGIESFAWDDLEQRYHDAMREREAVERGLHDEFSCLMDYFAIWAQTTTTHEVDRSFKRLKTQMAFVQHEEGALERKRQHCMLIFSANLPNIHVPALTGAADITVVKAFEGALALLES